MLPLCSKDGNLTLWTSFEDNNQQLTSRFAGGHVCAFAAATTADAVVVVAALDSGAMHIARGHLAGDDDSGIVSLSSRILETAPAPSQQPTNAQVRLC